MPLVPRITAISPGLAIAVLIALASAFIAEHYGGPTLLYALLLGLAFNYLSEMPKNQPGISFAGRTVLRIGVALLGARITLEQIMALGAQPLILVGIGVPATILTGLLCARLLGQTRHCGVLTGGAVAICGASAAMAIASVLPRDKRCDQQLIFTVIAVTTLSTVAMIAYPLLTKALGFDAVTAGMFLGGTIHDVAQVVGAGYLLGQEAGDTATFTKLLRVAMLVPTVLVINLLMARGQPRGDRPPLLPLFLVGFLVLVGINSIGWVPDTWQQWLTECSRWCLVTAIAAIGLKASLKELSKLGWKPLLLVVLETLVLAAIAIVILKV